MLMVPVPAGAAFRRNFTVELTLRVFALRVCAVKSPRSPSNGRPHGRATLPDTQTWKIDELSRQAGVSVDTIRYYAREGLLASPSRNGRNAWYGPRHLDRIHQIVDLRARRFSLAAIKALLEADLAGTESVLVGGVFSLGELVQRSGIDLPLIERLQEAGLLPASGAEGGVGFDAADLDVLDAVGELVSIGTPVSVVVALVQIYAQHFDKLQEAVHDLLTGVGAASGDPEAILAARTSLGAEAGRAAEAADRVLGYMHRRTLRRLALTNGDRAAGR